MAPHQPSPSLPPAAFFAFPWPPAPAPASPAPALPKCRKPENLLYYSGTGRRVEVHWFSAFSSGPVSPCLWWLTGHAMPTAW